MARTPYRVLYPNHRFYIRVEDGGGYRMLPAMSVYVDLFNPTDDRDTLVIGKALDGANEEDLHNLPTKLEVWLMPTSRALGVCIRARVAVDRWHWSPLDLDCQTDGSALEWVKGGLVELNVDRISYEDAPSDVQAFVGR